MAFKIDAKRLNGFVDQLLPQQTIGQRNRHGRETLSLCLACDVEPLAPFAGCFHGQLRRYSATTAAAVPLARVGMQNFQNPWHPCAMLHSLARCVRVVPAARPPGVELDAFSRIPSRFPALSCCSVMQALIFAFVISACAAAGESDSKSYNFAAIWLMLLTVGFSIVCTLVLRKVRWRCAWHCSIEPCRCPFPTRLTLSLPLHALSP